MQQPQLPIAGELGYWQRLCKTLDRVDRGRSDGRQLQRHPRYRAAMGTDSASQPIGHAGANHASPSVCSTARLLRRDHGKVKAAHSRRSCVDDGENCRHRDQSVTFQQARQHAAHTPAQCLKRPDGQWAKMAWGASPWCGRQTPTHLMDKRGGGSNGLVYRTSLAQTGGPCGPPSEPPKLGAQTTKPQVLR